MKYEDINPETEKYILEEFKTDSIIIDKIPHTEYIAKAKDLICQLSMRFVKREYQFYLEAEIADYKEIATIENRKNDRNFISPGSIYLDIFGERPADKKTAIILLYEIIVKTYSATMGSERLLKKFAAGFDVIMPNIIDRNDLELLYCRAGPTFENVLVTLCSLINDNYALLFKKNNGELIGFTSDTLLARLKANPSSMVDFEEESFTLKNTFSGKIKKINFDLTKFPNGKIQNANYPNLQKNPIIFEISY